MKSFLMIAALLTGGLFASLSTPSTAEARPRYYSGYSAPRYYGGGPGYYRGYNYGYRNNYYRGGYNRGYYNRGYYGGGYYGGSGVYIGGQGGGVNIRW
ncbi:MAG TPA: hypothetical protein VL096_14640 [Pirellulaceae bacterium]|nr:hypothetical protein [Pirellulaceae bacterium]